MKSANIVKKLKKEGYNIVYKKWEYSPSIPFVQLDGFEFAIVEDTHQGGRLGCNLDFIYHEVREALDIARKNNPLFIKKIEEAPSEKWYYSRYLILNMEDYYKYIKGIYPFNDYYYKVIEKLKRIWN